jgi:hypothetical protein
MLVGPSATAVRATRLVVVAMGGKGRIGMRRVAIRLAIVAMLLGNWLLAFAGAAFADSRCNGGRGLTVWQDGNQGGPSATWCANSNGVADIADLSTKTDNLFFGANWNDRISSWQTFNMTSTLITCLVQNTNYTYSDATRNSRITGNNTITYVGNAANDQASSVRSPASSCPTS